MLLGTKMAGEKGRTIWLFQHRVRPSCIVSSAIHFKVVILSGIDNTDRGNLAGEVLLSWDAPSYLLFPSLSGWHGIPFRRADAGSRLPLRVFRGISFRVAGDG